MNCNLRIPAVTDPKNVAFAECPRVGDIIVALGVKYRVTLVCWYSASLPDIITEIVADQSTIPGPFNPFQDYA